MVCNQLIEVHRRTTDGGTLEEDVDFQYDAYGNRLIKIVDENGDGDVDYRQRYGLDGWNSAKSAPLGNENWDVWADLNGGYNLQTRYLRGDVVDQLFARIKNNGQAFWYFADHLGSLRDITDNSGVVKDSLTYDGFGNITAETDPAFRGRYAWTDREYDTEIDLQYNRARYYDAATSRWLSQDPQGFDAGDGNLYRYVLARPSMYSDPSGLQFYSQTGQGNVWDLGGVNKYLRDLEKFINNPLGALPPLEIPYQQMGLFGNNLLGYSGKVNFNGVTEVRLKLHEKPMDNANRYYKVEIELSGQLDRARIAKMRAGSFLCVYDVAIFNSIIYEPEEGKAGNLEILGGFDIKCYHNSRILGLVDYRKNDEKQQQLGLSLFHVGTYSLFTFQNDISITSNIVDNTWSGKGTFVVDKENRLILKRLFPNIGGGVSLSFPNLSNLSKFEVLGFIRVFKY